MNTLKNFAAIGSIIAATGCAGNPQMPDPTAPVVTVEMPDYLPAVEAKPLQKPEKKIQKKDNEYDVVRIILESKKRMDEAMKVIDPVNKALYKGMWGQDPQCNDSDPKIKTMRGKYSETVKGYKETLVKVIVEHTFDRSLYECSRDGKIDADCRKGLNSDFGRFLVDERKTMSEYWQAYADCYKEKFKGGLPVKTP